MGVAKGEVTRQYIIKADPDVIVKELRGLGFRVILNVAFKELEKQAARHKGDVVVCEMQVDPVGTSLYITPILKGGWHRSVIRAGLVRTGLVVVGNRVELAAYLVDRGLEL